MDPHVSHSTARGPRGALVPSAQDLESVSSPRSVSLPRVTLLLSVITVANIAFWGCTLTQAHRYSALLSAGLLAYGFGLRHAVDADHISAIDNTTRRLMQKGKRPVGVGFYFSLGHSSVVILLCAGLALASAYVQAHLPQWRSVGGWLGTVVSVAFLYIIGLINLLVLRDLYQSYRHPDGAEPAAPRGILARILAPVTRLVHSSWQMFFVGFLFGLGFDTATEVGLLALSARSGQSGIPFWTVMLLPVLFAVGMCLVDTLDGVLMLGAYGWAMVRPERKLAYNIIITGVSVLVAFIIGTLEIVQVLAPRFELAGVLFDHAGYVIVGLFALFWVMSMARERLRYSG